MERPLGFVPDVDTFSFHIHQNDELIQNGDSNTNSAPELLFGNDCEFGADVCCKSPVVNHMPWHDPQ